MAARAKSVNISLWLNYLFNRVPMTVPLHSCSPQVKDTAADNQNLINEILLGLKPFKKKRKRQKKKKIAAGCSSAVDCTSLLRQASCLSKDYY